MPEARRSISWGSEWHCRIFPGGQFVRLAFAKNAICAGAPSSPQPHGGCPCFRFLYQPDAASGSAAGGRSRGDWQSTADRRSIEFSKGAVAGCGLSILRPGGVQLASSRQSTGRTGVTEAAGSGNSERASIGGFHAGAAEFVPAGGHTSRGDDRANEYAVEE